MYLLSQSYTTRYELVPEDNFQSHQLPEFMICHPSPWNIKSVKKFNISKDLLSYITVVINPYHAIVEFEPERLETYTVLDAEYRKMLKDHFKDDLIAFLDAITITCDQILNFCRIGGFEPWRMCCGQVFEKKGIYSLDGKCFKTHSMENHRFLMSSNFDAVQVVLVMGEEDRLEYLNAAIATWSSHALKGAPFAIINENEDPITAMFSSKFIDFGMMTRTKIKKKIIDRGGIDCVDEKGYNQRNCKVAAMNKLIEKNIGCIPIGLRLTKSADKHYCTPKEALQIINSTNVLRQFLQETPETLNPIILCKRECVQTIFETEMSSQILNNKYLNNILRPDGKARLMVHTMYFPSFDTEVIKQIPKGIMDWLGDVGGNCGFYLGASLFSIIELLYFSFKMIVHLICCHL